MFVCVCVCVLILTGMQKDIYQMFKSTVVPLLWQAERINTYLARIPLICLLFPTLLLFCWQDHLIRVLAQFRF
jgi:hypothetical protein